MTYSNKKEELQVSILRKTLKKFGKWVANSFPLNSIRVLGLKLCGFAVGHKVYIGGGLIVASTISENVCKLIIKERVAIGPRVTMILSSDANWSKLMEQIEPIKSFIILEDDCWIGAGVIILPGITIGKGSIVGAGSIVTKDVPPFTVVAGNPAKFIKNLKEF